MSESNFLLIANLKRGGIKMKKGMTLMELLVASLITSISISSMMMSFVICKKIITRNSYQRTATILANQLFEGLQRRSEKKTAEEFIQTTHPTQSYQMPSTVYDYGQGYVSYRKYFIKWDTSTILTPSTLSSLTLAKLRISWDEEYIEEDTNNSITMQMITNEPY